jgi:hypothetical protein
MKNEMRLQGIGLVEGTAAGSLKVGDVTRWNNGGLERITSVELSKTGKTIIVEIEYYSNVLNEMVQAERKFRVTRLVNVIASYEMIEEETEAAEADHAEIKQSVHEISYRFTDHGGYVEVMLFVEDVANEMVLVAQKEAEFKNMKEAAHLLNILQKSGNKVEIVETVAYTG